MNPAQKTFNHIVAFDVGKESLAVHVLPGDERQSIANEPKKIRKLLMAQMWRNTKLNLGPLLVVCEATGGYERQLLEICVELGIAAHKAHGSRVRNFAKYLGLIAKNDPIDARVLALFGVKTDNLRLYASPTPEQEALIDLRARRDQIQTMLLAETNRLEHVRHESVTKSLKKHIEVLRQALAEFETMIAAHIEASKELARQSGPYAHPEVHRLRNRYGSARLYARAWHIHQGRDRQHGRRCPLRRRERQKKPPPPYRSRPGRRPQSALHGGPDRNPV